MSELFSHSRLSNFENCPKKFQYRYVLKLPSEVESIEGFVGKRVHEVLERLYRFADSGRVPSLQQVLERYRAFWEEHWDAEHIRIVRREISVDDYRQLGEHCLAGYYRRFYPFDADETLGIEERVTFSLDNGDSYQIQGIIDRVVRARDGAIEIHDYKTGKRVPRQKDLDEDRQLALYQIGAQERWGRDVPVRLVWHFLQSGQTRTSTRTPEQLDTLGQATIELIDRIRAETAYEPKTGPLCNWCEYADRCPVGPGRKAGDRPPQAPPVLEGSGNPSPPPAGQLTLLGRRQS